MKIVRLEKFEMNMALEPGSDRIVVVETLHADIGQFTGGWKFDNPVRIKKLRHKDALRNCQQAIFVELSWDDDTNRVQLVVYKDPPGFATKLAASGVSLDKLLPADVREIATIVPVGAEKRKLELDLARQKQRFDPYTKFEGAERNHLCLSLCYGVRLPFFGWQWGELDHRFNHFFPVGSAAERFGLPPIALDYETLSSLPVGHEFYRLPLRRVYDPKVPARRLADGCNALSNLWQISIPLSYPPDWSNEAYRSIRGMSRISPKMWSAYLAFLEGRFLDSVGLEIEKSSASGTGEGAPRECSGESEILIGECYSGPYEKLEMFGRKFLFHVREAGKLVYVVDAPVYAISARVHPDYGSAHRDAIGAGYWREFLDAGVRRVYHAGQWMMRAFKTIQQVAAR